MSPFGSGLQGEKTLRRATHSEKILMNGKPRIRQKMEDPALRTASALRGSPGTALATTFLFVACAAFHSVPPLRTDNVLFWRVRGPETVNSEAYLLGSVHAGRADRPLVLDQRLGA